MISRAVLSKALVKASKAAVLMLVAFCIPIVQIPFVMLLYPLFFVFPEFSETGPYVEFTFLYVVLKHPLAWLLFGSYFFLLSFIAQVVVQRAYERQEVNRQDKNDEA